MDVVPLIGVVWWIMLPLTFFLLPDTLRKCKVKPAHIGRIGLYSAIFGVLALLGSVQLPMLVMSVLRLIGLEDSMVYTWLQYPESNRARVIPFCMLIFSTIFWGFASSRYIRLPLPWFVAFMLSFVSALLAIVFLAPWPGFLHALVRDW